MKTKEKIYSVKIERKVLGGLIKCPKIFPEVERFITEKDFFVDLHSTIFAVIRSLIANNLSVDTVQIAEKIKNIQATFKDEDGNDIDVFRYLGDVAFTETTPKAVMEFSKDLVKYRIRREILETAREIAMYIKKCGDDSVDEIIAKCDEKYGAKMAEYTLDDEPAKLFEGIEELIEERGENPNDESGLMTPYKDFNDAYGGLRAGNIYAVCSRPGQGKTTWINDVCFKTAQINNIKVLLLDTEMDTQDIQFRMAASTTGVSMWHLETGRWRMNADTTEKVRSTLPNLEKRNSGVFHVHVGNKNIDQICSLVRRWYLTEVGRGNPCLIAYDYVKLTGERVGQNWREDQAIGDKIDKLKKLSEEIQAPLITAMQLNRQGGERGGTGIVDDSSSIATSDRMQWFASFVAIFRRKSTDEMAEDNQVDENGNVVRDYGTHKLIPVKTRFQGRQAAGHQDLVRRVNEDGRVHYEANCLFFNVDNFNVQERGTLRDLVNDEREQFSVEDLQNNDGEIDV